MFSRFVWVSEQLWDGESTAIVPDPEIEFTRRFGYIRYDETNHAAAFFDRRDHSLIGILMSVQVVREGSNYAIFGYDADDDPICWIIEPRESLARLP